MRNRRTVVVAFLLIAVLLLGIGYAALTDTLTIIGNATIDKNAANNEFDEKIFFSASEVVSSTGSGDQSADKASHTADDATFAVHSLAVKGETAVFKFTVTNDSNVDAKVLVNSTKTSGATNPSNSNGDKFTVTYDYSNPDKVITSGGTMVITVTVTVANPVVDADTATFGLEMNVTTDLTAVES